MRIEISTCVGPAARDTTIEDVVFEIGELWPAGTAGSHCLKKQLLGI
jgi:hypothetical protein